MVLTETKRVLYLYKHIQTGQDIILTYQDDGKGFPQTFDVDESETIGIQLITGLTEQIDGNLTLKNHKPPIFAVHF